MASDDDSEFWCKRLQPNVFFEDFKAISKIAKMLNIVGAKMDVSSNMTYFSTQTVYDAKNLIWICLLRLHKVIKRLESDYKDISRFKVVEPNKTYPQPYFKWRSLSGKEITVKSPLQSYLRIQRKGIDPNQKIE